jgi:CTP:molybdopterin cytidylyltransferase MocA
MGQPKALLPWHGATLLEFHVEQLLAGGVRRVLLVLGHEAAKIRQQAGWLPCVSVILNPDYGEGKTTSVRAGMAAVPADADSVLVLAVDQPRPAGLIHELCKAHAASRALITVPAHGGRHGHPTIFARSLFPEMREIAEETQGLRAVRHRHRDQTQVIQTATHLPLVDFNTPDEYQAARAFFASFGEAR